MENFHQISQDRKVLRKEAKEAEQSEGPKAKVVQGALDGLNADAAKFHIADHGGLSGAKHRLRTDKERTEQSLVIDEAAIEAELGIGYREAEDLLETNAELSEYKMSLMLQSKRDPTTRSKNTRLLDFAKKELDAVGSALETKRENDPVNVRAAELVEYKKGLHKEGHIAATPSVVKYLEAIGMRMIDGKPMFLHGPTGTGKTSLARFSAEHFTDKKAEMVYCNPQTRESNIWGKTGIRPTESGAIETVEIHGPLARAAKEGKVVIFDEFTALPREQQVFIKGIFNAKPGDTISVVGNGEVTIASGFQMIFTANLKSEKNPERQELPPEIAREFEQNNLEVGYTPKEEAYDIMLSRLMNADGSVDLSYYDMNVTLPKFCEAMSEIQEAYTGVLDKNVAQLTQTLGAGNKPPSLKKFVLTQGTVENILDAWKTEKQLKNGRTFAEFMDERLKTALTFKEYSEADRVLTAKVLASKGFLRTLSEEELSLPPNTLNFDAARKLRGDEAKKELIKNSSEVRHLSIKEVAELDPFGLRQASAKAEAEDLLPEDKKAKKASGSRNRAGAIQITLDKIKQENASFFEETFSKWNYNEDQKEKARNAEVLIVSPKDIDWEGMKDTDAAKAGEYSLNPDTQSIDFANYPPEKIKVLDLTNMRGNQLHEIGKYLADNFGATHHIPGIEYWKFIIENPDKAPDSLKDGNYHYFFGSLLRSHGGRTFVPCVYWYGSEFFRSGYWLGSGWDSDGRVVLLEK